MPFNSYFFILLFLPAALAVYYAASLSPARQLRLPLLIALTLAFYAKAAANQLPLLLGSVVLNYLCARAIVRLEGQARRAVLSVGVAANIGVLLYFKYTNFLVDTLNDVTGSGISAPHILLPLAISFYTFQQIAFLVDTSRGQVTAAHPLGYASSILFFPIIISGPITFYREIGPQLEKQPEANAIPSNLLIGLVLFSVGLFKKTVIADSFSLWVDPLFAMSATSQSIGAAGAWGAAVAYLLQIYYDFSGYSDMALGIARMFGILLPLNFFSPIRSTSIIEYWRRWHITLGRFVNAYIFQVISIRLSRWAAQRRFGRKQMLIAGTLVPTFCTMLIIGTWHGGNWTFVVFGAMHGIYMVVNEYYKFTTRKKRKGRSPTQRQLVFSNLLTMVCVVVALVVFRAPDLATAGRIWVDMTGVNGVGATLTAGWPVLPALGGWGILLAILPSLAITYLFPNTAQFMARFEPALEWSRWRGVSPPVLRIGWRPTVGWASAVGFVLFVGFAFIGRGSTSFVYFGF